MTSFEYVNILHLGVGNVGRSVMELIKQNHDRIREESWINLKYCGFFSSKSGYFYSLGFPDEELHKYNNKAFASSIDDAVNKIPLPFVVIDTTASEDTSDILIRSLKRGGSVVMSNKRPLSSSQELFDKFDSWGTRVGYNTTVGAALPIIHTLKNMLITGDEVLEIEGCLSGTLGFVCTEMENGLSFSEAMKLAIERRYTESDPLQDLSGRDVARKALILARVMGWKIELKDLNIHPFCEYAGNYIDQSNYINALKVYDDEFKKRTEIAQRNNKKLRYVTRLKDGKVTADLCEVDESSLMGRIRGDNNIASFTTRRYNDFPLVIQGPGGGSEITAGGVLTDILSVFKNN